MESKFQPAGLSEAAADEIAGLLQDRLIALIDLGLTLKHAHWNVVGPGFLAVHEMFDEQVAVVRDLADEVAERIALIGHIPNGLAGHLTAQRSWDDYSLGRAVVPAHLGALDKVYDGVIGDHREAINRVEKIDPVTADLLTAQTGKLEMFQWFVRAHIENTSGKLATEGEETELGAAAAAATFDPLA